MTRAQGIGRLGVPLAALLIAGGLGLVALSWLIDRATIRTSVEAQIREATGLDIVVNGAVDVSIFPSSEVTLHDVTLRGYQANDSAFGVDRLTANLRLLPLLTQNVEIADITLTQPRVTVTRDAERHINWTPILDRLAQSMKPGSGNPVSFSEIVIKDGTLTYRDDVGDISETVSDIDLSLAWPSISRSFAATGQFDWRGERVDGSLSLNNFVAAISGERSGIKARMVSAPLKFAFDGAIANRTSLMLEGTSTADSPSLRNAMRWMGQTAPGSGGLGRFALKARTNLVGGTIALTNVNVELDGNAAEGVLTFNNTDRRTLQGTLAVDALDLTPYMQTFRLLAVGARDWSRQSFDLRDFSATDLDLRLSAAKVTVGGSKLGRTAIGANLRGGKLALSIGEAQIYGGIAKGSFSVTRSDAVADVKAQFQFTDIDLQSSTADLFNGKRITGRGNIDLAVEASGANPFEMAQSIDGSAMLTGHDGAIMGFNVEQLLKRLERRPLSGTGNFRTGVTPFDKLDVAVRLSDGVATAEDIRIDGPTTRLTLTGTASVPARDYDLKGVASLVSTSGEAAPDFQLPFVIQGPWDDPLIFPDSDILIRRSPASAPLLDSLKDGKTRDALRAVIDRFTGAKKKTPDEPSQPQAGIPATTVDPRVTTPAPVPVEGMTKIPSGAPVAEDTPVPSPAADATPAATPVPAPNLAAESASPAMTTPPESPPAAPPPALITEPNSATSH